MNSYKERLESVSALHRHDLDRAKARYTGHVTVHWSEGEPMCEESSLRRPIKGSTHHVPPKPQTEVQDASR
jgi:hypothetical protein